MWSCRTSVCAAVMQPSGSRDYPAASLGRQGPSRPPFETPAAWPANLQQRHTARLSFARAAQQNPALCRCSLSVRSRTSAHHASCSKGLRARRGLCRFSPQAFSKVNTTAIHPSRHWNPIVPGALSTCLSQRYYLVGDCSHNPTQLGFKCLGSVRNHARSALPG